MEIEHKTEFASRDRIPELSLYEGTCLFDPGVGIKLAVCFIHSCTMKEFDFYLGLGYRKFAYRFFKYVCRCDRCTSLRVLANEYTPSRADKHLLKKNKQVEMTIGPLEYSRSHYMLYCKHHAARGFKVLDEATYIQEFYLSPTTAAVTEMYLDRLLIGLGFIDIGESSLSSVYFVYDPAFGHLSPGIYSIIREIDLARNMGKRYYYLGLYCKGQRFLGYKDRFVPYETLDHATGMWKRHDGT